MLKEVLGQSGDFTVVGIAHGGLEGLELCVQTKPDMVLVDVMLPGMSGLEIVSRLRQLDSHVLLVAISGLTTKEAIHTVLSMGASAFVPKSIPTEELLLILQSVVTGTVQMRSEEAEALRWAVRNQRAYKAIMPDDVAVLRLFAQGITVKEIAIKMGLTESSIYKTLRKNKQRLGATSDWDLRLAAQRLGLV